VSVDEPIAPAPSPNVASPTAKMVKDRLQNLGFEIVSESESIVSTGKNLIVETIAARRAGEYAFVYLYETPDVETAKAYETALRSSHGAVARLGTVVFWVFVTPKDDAHASTLLGTIATDQ
jgi:hypothetical protein